MDETTEAKQETTETKLIDDSQEPTVENKDHEVKSGEESTNKSLDEEKSSQDKEQVVDATPATDAIVVPLVDIEEKNALVDDVEEKVEVSKGNDDTDGNNKEEESKETTNNEGDSGQRESELVESLPKELDTNSESQSKTDLMPQDAVEVPNTVVSATADVPTAIITETPDAITAEVSAANVAPVEITAEAPAASVAPAEVTTEAPAASVALAEVTTDAPAANVALAEVTTDAPAANVALAEVTIEAPAASVAPVSSSLAAPVDSKRRGSIEKMSNFLRQFRSSGGFRKFTASQFMKVWNHYDSDGNGFIADSELDGFLREFVLSSVSEGDMRPEILSESAMALFKETFMDAFDENQDGMIDIAELAEILPTDENFLLLFHLKNPVESSVEFMKIWREYDKNCKGYIESTELKSFLKHILDNQKTSVSDEKLEEYTETILNLFDSNRDGKLQLCEMARLMPVKQNFLTKPILKGASCITRSDIDRLFRIYDQNRNGTIEDEELSGLLKDLMDLGKKDYALSDIENMKQVIMDHWDLDHDGTISKSELRMFLIQQCKLSAESQGISYDDEEDDYDDDDFD